MTTLAGREVLAATGTLLPTHERPGERYVETFIDASVNDTLPCLRPRIKPATRACCHPDDVPTRPGDAGRSYAIGHTTSMLRQL